MGDELEVGRFASLPEAEAVAALLRTHGIAARLGDAHTTNSLSHLQIALGGARIVVPDHQAYEARELVARARKGEFAAELALDDVDDEDGDDATAPRGTMSGLKAAAPIIIAMIFLAPVAGCLVLTLA